MHPGSGTRTSPLDCLLALWSTSYSMCAASAALQYYSIAALVSARLKELKLV